MNLVEFHNNYYSKPKYPITETEKELEQKQMRIRGAG